MSKKLLGGGKKKAATAAPETKGGPIVTPLGLGDPLAERLRRRRGIASVPLPTILSSTLGG